MNDEALPAGWAEASLGDLIEGFQSGRSLSGAGRPAGIREIGVLKISAVTWGEFNPSENKALPAGTVPRDYERIHRGDLLISRANTAELVGAVVRVKDDHPNLMLPDKLLRIVLQTNIDPDFVKFALRTPAARAHLEDNATGTSQSMRNLSQPKMAATPLWLPPLAEQRRIVEKVEALLAQVNAAQARLAKVPTILKRFRQSILSAACSGRLVADLVDSSDSVEGEFDFLPTLPQGWAWSTAIESCSQVIDCHNKTAPYASSGIRLLRTTNIRDGRLVLDDARYVTEETYRFWSRRCPPEPGDVLFTREAPMGEAALIPQGLRICMGQRIMLLRAKPGLTIPEFVLLAVRAPYVAQYAAELAVGSGVLHLRVGDVERLPIPVPPLEIQHEVVRRVDALFKLADAIEARVAGATARADKITQAILAKAFRGELVPTEAELARQEGRDYEPASALLARIRAERATSEAAAKPARRSRTLAATPAPAKAKLARQETSGRTARSR